jgi:hypothetical protein
MDKIIQLYTSLISKLPGRKNYIFWILVALIAKSLFFGYKVWFEPDRYANVHYTQSIAAEATDTWSYFGPMEALKNTGRYWTPEHEDYRMPGYGWIYYALRMFLSVNATTEVIIFLQLILSAISVFVLAEIAFLVFRRESYFYLTFFLYAISTFVSIYDYSLLTESFCASSFIFSVYFLLKSEKGSKNLLLSGLFLTWSTFMRPVMSLVFILFVIYLFFKDNKTAGKIFNIKTIIVFLIPFMIIDGAWIVRNYQLYHRVIPLTKYRFYAVTEFTYLSHLNFMLQSYGGSVASWEPEADVQFFTPRNDFKNGKKIVPPNYIYTSKFNYDSLVIVRDLIRDVKDEKIDTNVRKVEEQELIRRLDLYTKSVQDEKPFLFYIYARWRFFKTFLIHSGTHNLFYRGSSELSKPALLAKVFYSFLYIFILIGGFIGSFYLLFKGLKNIDYFLIGTIGLYFAFVTPIVVRMDQIRYFVPGYPFFLIATVVLLIMIADRFAKKAN